VGGIVPAGRSGNEHARRLIRIIVAISHERLGEVGPPESPDYSLSSCYESKKPGWWDITGTSRSCSSEDAKVKQLTPLQAPGHLF